MQNSALMARNNKKRTQSMLLNKEKQKKCYSNEEKWKILALS